MKSQINYFDRIIKVLKELKQDHPDVEISKHYCLATDSGEFSLTDKELYLALIKHKNELEMNTLSDKDLEKVISDASQLFDVMEFEDQEDCEEDDEY